MPDRPIRVLQPITRLIVGGAQETAMLTAVHLLGDPALAGRYHVEIVSGGETGPEGSLIDEVRGRGVPLTILPSITRAIRPLADAGAFRSLVRMMRAPDGTAAFDVVHTHSSKAGVLGRLAARAAGVRVIVHTVHGWSFHDRMSAPRRATYVAMERTAARAGRKLIAVTPLDVEKGLAAGIGRREDYVVIRSGIELDRFRSDAALGAGTRAELDIDPGAVVIGSVTRLSPQKAPLDLVAAFAIVAARHPDACFLVAGDGPERGAVETALHAAGLSDRVRLLGVRRDVPAILAAMDIFVTSSLWEGLPRTVLQAMAMGLPVVASAADGTSEVVAEGESGHLVDRGRPDELADRIGGLVADPDRRARFGTAAASRVRAFGSRQMAAEIDTLYRELLTAPAISPARRRSRLRRGTRT